MRTTAYSGPKKLFAEVLDAVNGDPHNSASPNDGDAKKQQLLAVFFKN
ncbi:hypothetical protein VSR68_41785 [Paraburkholderia phymatum]